MSALPAPPRTCARHRRRRLRSVHSGNCSRPQQDNTSGRRSRRRSRRRRTARGVNHACRRGGRPQAVSRAAGAATRPWEPHRRHGARVLSPRPAHFNIGPRCALNPRTHRPLPPTFPTEMDATWGSGVVINSEQGALYLWDECNALDATFWTKTEMKHRH